MFEPVRCSRTITNERTVQAVPDDALVSDGGLSYIFILKTEAAVKKHTHGSGQAHAHEEDDGHEGEFVFP